MVRQRPETARLRTSSEPRLRPAARNPPAVPPSPDSRWRARLRAQSRCKGRAGNSTHRETWQLPLTRQTARPAFAKLAGGRHNILKERLTAGRRSLVRAWLARPETPRNHAEITRRMAYSRDDSRSPSSLPASFMTLLSTAQHLARDTRRDP